MYNYAWLVLFFLIRIGMLYEDMYMKSISCCPLKSISAELFWTALNYKQCLLCAYFSPGSD